MTFVDITETEELVVGPGTARGIVEDLIFWDKKILLKINTENGEVFFEINFKNFKESEDWFAIQFFIFFSLVNIIGKSISVSGTLITDGEYYVIKQNWGRSLQYVDLAMLCIDENNKPYLAIVVFEKDEESVSGTQIRVKATLPIFISDIALITELSEIGEGEIRIFSYFVFFDNKEAISFIIYTRQMPPITTIFVS